MLRMLSAWWEQVAKREAGEITKEEYDKWRHRYPEFDTTQRWVKVVPSVIGVFHKPKKANGLFRFTLPNTEKPPPKGGGVELLAGFEPATY